ncbi:RNA polymerase sigma factor SigJ [Haloechinothrix sp. LS1_15]|uniref:RNA polymerase sigma factor SigJ n=1 Tax=Haloechinothrix sp. LS1_15 TaxID=2652248 RepID=UPI00294B3529|nr:RNA polymerase sigma factor SigJ [Haloechinothrix sp. LS1_15]
MTVPPGDLDALAADFTARRSDLLAVAYRITGIRSDAEDAVQEAWLRLAGTAPEVRAEIRDLGAWLATVVGRICLDRLRSAAARRERYVGQWLPEPVVTPLEGGDPTQPLTEIVHRDEVRMAAMVVLDRLTPEQRVAFVLHDALAVPFAEIASTLGCTTDAARQHASRARRIVAEADPPHRASLEQQRDLLERFMHALMNGDVDTVTHLLHPDVVLIGDADGKARTALQVVTGADKIARFAFGLRAQYSAEALAGGRLVLVNGDLGMYFPPHPGDTEHRALDARLHTIAVRDGSIAAFYDQANPDKLGTIP